MRGMGTGCSSDGDSPRAPRRWAESSRTPDAAPSFPEHSRCAQGSHTLALYGAGTPVLGARRTASDGPHERTTHQSCDESLRRLGLRCPMMRRHYDARRRFELTGQVTPIHSPALVDLVGRAPGAPPERPTGSQPTTSCRGLGATCQPWRQGGCHGWRSPITGCSPAVEPLLTGSSRAIGGKRNIRVSASARIILHSTAEFSGLFRTGARKIKPAGHRIRPSADR